MESRDELLVAYQRIEDLEEALEALIKRVRVCDDDQLIESKAYEDAKDILQC